jgi:hypothetical protein
VLVSLVPAVAVTAEITSCAGIGSTHFVNCDRTWF